MVNKTSILVALAVCILIIILGIHYESYEIVAEALFSGELLSVPSGDMYIIAHVLMGDVFAFLYKMSPNIPFLAAASIFVTLFSVLLFTQLLHTKNSKEISAYILLVIVAFAPNFTFAYNVRAIIISTMIGSAYLLVKSSQKYSWLLAAPCVIYGMQTRYEIGIFCISVTTIYFLLSGIASWQSSKKGYIILAFIGVFFYSYNNHVANKNPYLQRLFHLMYLTSSENSKNYVLQEYRNDDLRREALSNYFIADTAFINTMSFPNTSNVLFEKIKNKLCTPSSVNTTLYELRNAKEEIIVFLISLIILLSVPKVRKRSLLVNFFMLFTLLSLFYLTKVDVRFASPYLMASTFFNLLWVAQHNHTFKVRKWAFFCMLAITAICFINAIRESEKLRVIEKNNRSFITTLNSMPQKIIALDGNSVKILNTGLVDHVNIISTKKIFPVDIGELACLYSASSIIRRQFGINSMDMKSVYEFLSNNPEVIYLTHQDRARFISGYMKELYGIDIAFIRMNYPPIIIENNPVYIYQLKCATFATRLYSAPQN